MPGGDVRLADVVKEFDGVTAVDRIDLHIEPGEFFSMLGPSGCGKTTTLRMIGGFEFPTSGEVFVDGRDMSSTPPHKRPINTVFQSYALFPHLSVVDNVAFGLRRARITRADVRTRAAEALEMVQMTPYASRKPWQLSGGQQQRVALARALVLKPAVLLLDEPLGALDAKLRRALQIELKALQQQVGISFVYVTHDQEEALTMSDRIAVLNRGRVDQVASPETIYEQPETAFVAEFLGTSNLMTAMASGTVDGGCRVRVGEFDLLAASGALTTTGTVKIVVRPERITLESHDSTGLNRLPGMVDRVVYMGNSKRVIVRLPTGDSLQVLVQNTGSEAEYAQGDPIRAHLPPEALRVLPAARLQSDEETTEIDAQPTRLEAAPHSG